MCPSLKMDCFMFIYNHIALHFIISLLSLTSNEWLSYIDARANRKRNQVQTIKSHGQHWEQDTVRREQSKKKNKQTNKLKNQKYKKNTIHKTKTMNNVEPTKKKTPVMLCIVKSGKYLVCDRRMETNPRSNSVRYRLVSSGFESFNEFENILFQIGDSIHSEYFVLDC